MAAVTQQINVRLDHERAQALRDEARRQNRSVTSVVDEAVETYLALVSPRQLKGRKGRI